MVTLEKLKATFAKLGYKWSTTQPNIFGIRSTLNVPDVFNDIVGVAWTQPALPASLSGLQQQQWLNSFFITDDAGKPLVEDGDPGKATKQALARLAPLVGQERVKFWSATTDPGTYWLQNPVAGGTAVLVPGQYAGAYQLGYHQDNRAHPALVQRGGPVSIYRDNNRDLVPDAAGKPQSGMFGINIHHADSRIITQRIGRWSAGCQVFPSSQEHAQLLALCERYRTSSGNKFTYTLLTEKQLAA